MVGAWLRVLGIEFLSCTSDMDEDGEWIAIWTER